MTQTLKQKLTPGILAALAQRKTTARAVAKLFDVSESHFSHTIRNLIENKRCGVPPDQTEAHLAEALQEFILRPPAPTVTKKKNAHELKVSRTSFRLDLAHKVVNKTRTVHAAAREANCSVRTMYRYVGLIDGT